MKQLPKLRNLSSFRFFIGLENFHSFEENQHHDAQSSKTSGFRGNQTSARISQDQHTLLLLSHTHTLLFNMNYERFFKQYVNFIKDSFIPTYIAFQNRKKKSRLFYRTSGEVPNVDPFSATTGQVVCQWETETWKIQTQKNNKGTLI